MAKGSINFTVSLVILSYFVVQAYAGLVPSLARWQFALIFWFVVAVLMRNFRFLFAHCAALVAFGFVISILHYNSLSVANGLLALGHPSTPLYMILFVIFPMVFFNLTFDAYSLMKDLPAIASVRVPAYILLILSSGEMFNARFDEIREHLAVRGIDVSGGFARIRHAVTYLPPLLLALIQEAVYRYSYIGMVGCPTDRFPIRKKEPRISRAQKISFAGLLALLVLRLAI